MENYDHRFFPFFIGGDQSPAKHSFQDNSIHFPSTGLREGNVLWKIECFLED